MGSRSRAGKERIIASNADIPRDIWAEFSKSVRSRFHAMLWSDLPFSEYGSVEVLLLGSPGTVMTKENLEQMKNLRLIQTISAGVNHLDFSLIPPKVKVCGNVGAFAPQMAEHVFGMILYFAKNLQLEHEKLAKGVFDRNTKSIFLKGKTIGILGAGGIGQAVAKLAKAFGMKTLGINRSGTSVPHFDSVYKMGKVDLVLNRSDFVVVSLPLTNKTRNLIDAERLRLMKPNCVLVNVARGAIINQRDLYYHLKENPNFRCALDVWWNYPERHSASNFAQDYPFFELPNFLGSPHNSGEVPEDRVNSSLAALENITRYVRGQPLDGAVDRSEYL
jgi:phosphoglycerate dehydrogenase-like enzyme